MGSHTKNRPQAESITEEQIQAFIEKLRRKNRSASTLETYSRAMAYMPPCRKRSWTLPPGIFGKRKSHSSLSVCFQFTLNLFYPALLPLKMY